MYLGSYVELDGHDFASGVDVDEGALRERARRDAGAWRRVDRARKEGRLVVPPDMGDYDTGEGEEAGGGEGALFGMRSGAGVGGKRREDAWDAVVRAVEGRSLRLAAAYVGKREVAKQVAARVEAYWETRRVRDAKARAQEAAQEERRVRSVAKAVAKAVEKEWRRVVLVSSAPVVPLVVGIRERQSKC